METNETNQNNNISQNHALDALSLAISGEAPVKRTSSNTTISEYAVWAIGYIFAILPFLAVMICKVTNQNGNLFEDIFGVPDLFLAYTSILVSPWCASFTIMNQRIKNILSIVFASLLLLDALIYAIGEMGGVSHSLTMGIINIILGLLVLAASIFVYSAIYVQNKSKTKANKTYSEGNRK